MSSNNNDEDNKSKFTVLQGGVSPTSTEAPEQQSPPSGIIDEDLRAMISAIRSRAASRRKTGLFTYLNLWWENLHYDILVRDVIISQIKNFPDDWKRDGRCWSYNKLAIFNPFEPFALFHIWERDANGTARQELKLRRSSLRAIRKALRKVGCCEHMENQVSNKKSFFHNVL